LKYSIQGCHYAHVFYDRNGIPVVGESIPFSTFRKIYLVGDPAVTVRQGPIDDEVKQKNSYTALSIFAETKHNELLWLNLRKFRKEIPDVVENVVNMNEIWQPTRNKIEASGVGIGVAQYCEAAGLPVERMYKKTDKIENSMSAQLLMRAGKVLFPINAYWLEDAEDVIFNWTGLPSEEDDVVDNLSDGANDISLTVAREISAPQLVRSRPRAVMVGNHVGFTGQNRYNIPTYGLR
jgi:phage terminase large subunit-like protein